MISSINAFSGVSFPGLTQTENSGGQRSKQGDSGRRGSFSASAISSNTDATGLRVSDEQRKIIQELQKRDLEVRTHEQAHKAVGGSLAGAPNYSTVQGPNNRRYAVGGGVSIDSSPVPGDPEATADKARQVRAAALAPARPSAQDMSVAASATQMETQAQMERATAAYRRMGGETGLAPMGTGISISV